MGLKPNTPSPAFREACPSASRSEPQRPGQRRGAYTQAQLRRIIKAARSEGLHIAGIRPDGTIIVYEERNPLVPIDQSESTLADLDASRWGDQ